MFAQSRVNQELGREGILPFNKLWASNLPFSAPLAALGLRKYPLQKRQTHLTCNNRLDTMRHRHFHRTPRRRLQLCPQCRMSSQASLPIVQAPDPPPADNISPLRNKRCDFVWYHLPVLIWLLPRFGLVSPRCPHQTRCRLLWLCQYLPLSCSPLQATIRLRAVRCVALLDPCGGRVDRVRFWVLILAHLGKSSTLEGAL